jgi:alkylhydroperoxidase family enzyme
MPWIKVIGEAEAEGALRAVYARCREEMRAGEEIDNVTKISSLDPATMEAHNALYDSLMEGPGDLPHVERETIAVAVSSANGCHY